MIDIKVKRTAPKLVFEKSIFDNTEKYKTAQNMGAHFIGLILMKMNIGTGIFSDCGTIHANYQKDVNTIFVKEIKK